MQAGGGVLPGALSGFFAGTRLLKAAFSHSEHTDLSGKCRAYEIFLYHHPKLVEEKESQENMNSSLSRGEAQKQAECFCQCPLGLSLVSTKPETTFLVTAIPVSRLPLVTAHGV